MSGVTDQSGVEWKQLETAVPEALREADAATGTVAGEKPDAAVSVPAAPGGVPVELGLPRPRRYSAERPGPDAVPAGRMLETPASLSADPGGPAVTIVVPTRNEAANVLPLLERIDAGLGGYPLEVIFVDDSTDDTPAVVENACRRFPFVQLLHRPAGQRPGGLGGAVVAGFRQARAPYAVVMDGDLQHPPETAAALLAEATATNADVVIGSRYQAEGSASGLASGTRRFVSLATNGMSRLAFPRRLRGVTDVMSGLFLVRLEALDLDALRPSGYKILLELLVRGGRLRVQEVPYTFEARYAGESNASAREGLRFLRQILWLRVPRPARFALVGASGLVPNVVGTQLLASLGMHYIAAAVIATQVANVWNFVGCEAIVWDERPRSRTRRFLSFMSVNALDLVIRIPLLALFVRAGGMSVGVATFLTLATVLVLRYLVIDSVVYAAKSRRAAGAGLPVPNPQTEWEGI